ncbi:hypothetical protein FGB62_7g11 [Gracilaria domingensis]|nr:hypothetical protein FGB62_7g11 [Gracilaria domingensis]
MKTEFINKLLALELFFKINRQIIEKAFDPVQWNESLHLKSRHFIDFWLETGLLGIQGNADYGVSYAWMQLKFNRTPEYSSMAIFEKISSLKIFEILASATASECKCGVVLSENEISRKGLGSKDDLDPEDRAKIIAEVLGQIKYGAVSVVNSKEHNFVTLFAAEQNRQELPTRNEIPTIQF